MIASRYSIRILVLFFVLISQTVFAQSAKQKTNAPSPNSASATFLKYFQQGFSMKLLMTNYLTLGVQAFEGSPPSDERCGYIPGMEYPVGSCYDHLYSAGPVIGGVVDGVRRVSEAYNPNTGRGYFIPSEKDEFRNTIWVTSATDSSIVETGYYKKQPNKRFVDDDKDGIIDEDALDGEDNDNDWSSIADDIGSDGVADSSEHGCRGGYDPITNPDPAFDNWNPANYDSCHPTHSGKFPNMRSREIYTQGNGIPDHGEPHVDEDYAAFSDQDVYISATDTSPSLPTSHSRLGIKIIQNSYAWKSDIFDGILPIKYEFVNIGGKTIRDVYLGFFVDADVGLAQQNDGGYFDSLRTIFVANPSERNSTPFGFTLLETPVALESLKYTLQWYDFVPPCGGTLDEDLYACMSCEAFGGVHCIDENTFPTNTDVRFLFSFGPFRELKPGDTISTTVAFLSGTRLSAGSQSLKAHAEQAIKLWGRGWRQPLAPPSPCLEATSSDEGIKLQWNLEKPGCLNPLDTWDDSNKIAESFEPNHWRRSNPPAGATRGGRIFEGFRLYRAEEQNGTRTPFTFLREFDVADDIFGFNVGLQTEFTDSFARKGHTYWYAVTSFSIPDMTIITRPLSNGGVLYDTLYSEQYESSIEDNATKVYHSFRPSESLGEVLVVPNPYRGSEYYVNGDGFEGLEREWTPYKRMVRFIHLPSKATIRIYTIAGEVVATFTHDESAGDTEGQHDFHLFTESGRPLANGIFVFTVESEYGKQIGKFVIAR
ncbi:MAG: hypothetical protein HY960_06020 [Ignavibacteriae bacterium]|nr:hypothetical protein [Ignavibacteriota bacterium]